jgi:hypothetical protein
MLPTCLWLQEATDRIITRDEGEAYANSKGWLYVESSAKDAIGIQTSFEILACEYLERTSMLEAIAAQQAQWAAEQEVVVEKHVGEDESSGRNRFCLMCIIS